MVTHSEQGSCSGMADYDYICSQAHASSTNAAVVESDFLFSSNNITHVSVQFKLVQRIANYISNVCYQRTMLRETTVG
jgi:hypothetical protein